MKTRKRPATLPGVVAIFDQIRNTNRRSLRTPEMVPARGWHLCAIGETGPAGLGLFRNATRQLYRGCDRPIYGRECRGRQGVTFDRDAIARKGKGCGASFARCSETPGHQPDRWYLADNRPGPQNPAFRESPKPMNAHVRIPESQPTIDLLEVEDSINTALNAALMAHDFVEEMLARIARPGHAEAANTSSYALGVMRDAVRAAHDQFHEYLQDEFARRRQSRRTEGDDPDPVTCSRWKGAGVYRFHSLRDHEFLVAHWNDEMSWFELIVPVTGERLMAMCPELFQRSVSGLVSNEDLVAKVMGEAA